MIATKPMRAEPSVYPVMDQTRNPIFVLADEIAAYRGMSKRTVHQAAADGDIVRPMTIGRASVWLRTELDAIIAGLDRRSARDTRRRAELAAAT